MGQAQEILKGSVLWELPREGPEQRERALGLALVELVADQGFLLLEDFLISSLRDSILARLTGKVEEG
jgi:hypothetical protein